MNGKAQASRMPVIFVGHGSPMNAIEENEFTQGWREAARSAVPTPEHYSPLLYVLALADEGETVSIFNDRVTMGSISMMCVAFGLEGR